MIYCVQYANRPTFFLDSNVQGIMSHGHARRIAADVMGIEDTPSISVTEAENVTHRGPEWHWGNDA